MKKTFFISKPARPLFGVISVPGDKSISHRALILGAIAQGKTTVHGFLNGEDCLKTMGAMKAMGVEIESPSSQKLVIHGVGKYGLKAPKHPIDCGNSGTSMRLLAGLLAGQSFDSILIGDKSLSLRPMYRISIPLSQMGAEIQTQEGCAPIEIHGQKRLHGIHYELPQASAQVKSCLLLAGMYARGQTEIIEPFITRDHTERMLTTFSYPIEKGENRIVINAESECLGTEIYIPGDLSSAAFFIVAATLVEGSEVFLRQVGINPTRMGVIHILQQMQADITLLNKRLCGEEVVADILVKSSKLEGIDIPTPLVPLAIDEFPIIFIAAALAKGRTILHGAKELRTKESDRIEAMVTGLNHLGIKAIALPDGVVIEGGALEGGEVESYHDHRVAMAFAIAGAVSKTPIKINDCENVATSFPNFVKLAQMLNLDITEYEHNETQQ